MRRRSRNAASRVSGNEIRKKTRRTAPKISNACELPVENSSRSTERFPVARRHGLESGTEVLRVEGAAPDHHREPRDGSGLQQDRVPGQARQSVEEEEDLDEDRRVADHL